MAQRRRGRGRRSKKDLALVFGRSEDGEALHVLRRRSATGQVEAGTFRPLRDGHAITGEVVNLEARDDSPMLFDCETDAELSAPGRAEGGPPKVATNEYRRGWDAIWGRRSRPSAVN
jgi:hypothetical protein